MQRHKLLPVLLGLVLTLLFMLIPLRGLQPRILQQLSDFSYDTRLRLTMPKTVDPRIVILDIDERSLATEGHWPWPRNRLAQLVNMLFDDYKVALVGFDVVFAEHDRSSGLGELEHLAAGPLHDDQPFTKQLDQLRGTLNWDETFGHSLRGRPVVLGYYFNNDPKSRTGQLPPPVLPVKEAGLTGIPFIRASGYGANLPVLQENARSAGFFQNQLVSQDGVFRRVPLLIKHQGNLYESLPLAVISAITGDPFIVPVTDKDKQGHVVGLSALKIGGLSIPVDDQAAALVPYRGRERSFPYVSVVDVLNHKVKSNILAGAIVLVGTTAPGLVDLRSTPVQNVYPGVEVHANLISGILDGRVKSKPSYSSGIQVAQLLAVGLLLSITLPLLSPLMATLFTVLLAAVLTSLNLYVWNHWNLVLPIADSLVLILILYLVHTAYGYLVETINKRRITHMFGQYVPPEVVDELSNKRESMGMEGESRDMTVLFSDVRGFTTISEGLKPHELTQLMNAMLTPMTRIIHQHHGTIDKYMGDAIMAFWGAPLTDNEHARHALMAAMDMVTEMPHLRERFAARGWPPIRIGVGLNTGLMNVGNMGSEFRMAYTVLGDAVNLGSRLEGLTKQYGIDIMVSEFVKQRVAGFAFRELDRVRVKGKDEPVAIFEPLGPTADLDPEVAEHLNRYHEALACFRAQNWEGADVLLQQLQREDPERALYGIYLDRIAHYQANPPGADWDGAVTFTTK